MCKQAKNPPFSCRFPTQAMPISVNWMIQIKSEWTAGLYYCNSPKNAKADLPTFVEVWVETHRAVSCGHQTHSGWRYWVVMGEAYKEVKETSLIWSVKWSSEQSMNLKRKWKLSGWNTSTLQVTFFTEGMRKGGYFTTSKFFTLSFHVFLSVLCKQPLKCNTINFNDVTSSSES